MLRSSAAAARPRSTAVAASCDSRPRCPAAARRSELLSANAVLFADRAGLEDWQQSYARYDMYPPNVACPPSRPLERVGTPVVRRQSPPACLPAPASLPACQPVAAAGLTRRPCAAGASGS
jgi:hypothetical protein